MKKLPWYFGAIEKIFPYCPNCNKNSPKVQIHFGLAIQPSVVVSIICPPPALYVPAALHHDIALPCLINRFEKVLFLCRRPETFE